MNPSRSTRSLNYKVGLFCVVSFALFVTLIVFAIGARFGKETATYFIHFGETVKGMVKGSPVNFQGVKIGSVADMRFVGGLTEVRIEVDPGKAPIQTMTRASLDRAWVTGQVTVELSGWQPDGELVAEFGLIPAELSAGAVVMRTLPEAVERVTEILEEFDGVAAGLHRLLAPDAPLLARAEATLAELHGSARGLNALLSEPNVERVGSILTRLDSALARVDDRVLPDLEVTLARVRDLTPRLSGTLDRLHAAAGHIEEATAPAGLRALLTEGTALARDLREQVPRLGAAGAELELFLRGNRREVGRAMLELQSTLRELHGLARLLRGAPSALVWGTSPPKTPLRERYPEQPAAAPGGKE